MKLSGLQENLKQGLSITSHVAGKNINLPILNNILIETKKEGIKMISTNLEIGIVHNIRGKVDEEGVLTIDSKIISDFVNLLPNQKVTLKTKENDLYIECDNYKTKIKGQSAEDFPLIPEVNKEEFCKVKISDFKTALAQVVFAVSTSESKFELTGVLFEFKGTELTVVATDSYRLAEKTINIKNDAKINDKKIIIPSKTIQELLRILSNNDSNDLENNNEITFCFSDNQILFIIKNTELISKTIEGQYPDYKQIIPQNIKTKTKINRSDLIKAVKASSIFSKNGINDVNLEIVKENNKIIISSTSSQTGENVVDLDANIEGDNNKITVNYKFLLDGLNNIDGENVLLEITDSNTPCILKPESDKDYLYIVMPLKQ